MNGHKSGKGVYTYKDGVKYDGEYLNGLKSGTGKLYKADGSVSYEGTFLLGLPHGKGKAFEDGTWV